MKTSILEANIILKNKHRALINTAMDIVVDWELWESSKIFVCHSVSGKFSWKEDLHNYSKESIYTFNTLTKGNWKIEFKKESDGSTPETIIIDFDTENIKIFL